MRDIIIIGGGAIGASIARELSRYKLDILLLEKNTEPCQETTKANSAIIHGGYDAQPGTLKAKLNVEGRAMYSELAKELEFTYKIIGSMVLAFNKEDKKILEELYLRGRENKVKDLEIIDGDRARKIEPFISKNVISALFCSNVGIVDPFNYTYAMMENARDNGVELKVETEVIGLKKEDKSIKVRTNNGDYKGKFIINAAGLNSDKLSNMAGDFDFTILPTKGVYRILQKDKNFELEKVLFQTPSEKGKGVLVTPTYEANTMVGPTSEMIKELADPPAEEESLRVIDKLGRKSVTSLDIEKTIRTFTGIRAKADNGDFCIYPSKRMEGVVHVGGIESPGLSAAPAIAIYVKEILEDIGLELKAKDNFNPYRKKIPRLAKLEKERREELIEKDPKYGKKYVCVKVFQRQR